MERIRIVTISIEIIGRLMDDEWQKFRCQDSLFQADVSVRISQRKREKYNLENYDARFQVKRFCRYMEDVMCISEDWKQVQILPLYRNESFSVFLNQIFYTHAVQSHMIQIHSSMIDYRGEGILFLGPSGIGKTTQAELWKQYRNALIINGDMNFVQETEECCLGWGTPWHGSSPYCENRNVQVRALIVLKQAQKNSIRLLDGFEKVQSVMNNILYPTWLENGMGLCLETLDHLLKQVPVYELSCRPDEDAVRLTEETVFGVKENE